MCSKLMHQKIELENRDFFRFIKQKRSASDDYNSWLVVVLFYIAIHHAESYFADQNIHNEKHTDRESYLYDNVYSKNYDKTKEMKRNYDRIKSECNRARYKGLVPTAETLDEVELCTNEFVKCADIFLAK